MIDLPPIADLIDIGERFRRPSNIGRLDACHGQAIMAAATYVLDGEAKAAPEADLGHQVHGAVQAGMILRRGGMEWGDAIATACNVAAKNGMDSWSVVCVQRTLEFYRDLILKYEIEPDNILVEHPLDMEATGFRRKGTADLVLVIPYKLVVICDLKAGFVDQGDAADHDQLAVYSAAAAATFKASTVIVWIYQPREAPANRASVAKYDANTLRATVGWSRAVLERSRLPTATLCAGFVQCATCPALRRCPVAKAYLMDAQESLTVLGNPTTPSEWGAAIGAAKLAEAWAKKWKESGKEYMEAGGLAIGFKLGAGRSLATVANVPEAFAKLEAAGMRAEALEAASLSASKLTPAAYQVIEDHITSNISAPSLVADKRGKGAA